MTQPSLFSKVRNFLIGAPRNPLNPEMRHHIALIAFLAWVGLGADGLSSSCYGPEEAFVALGVHTHLSLYLAIATAFTVFIISIGYNQVIELFPTGGGGYRVATRLIGPYAGLVSGAALFVDYVLTIAVSVASGTDALFSLVPVGFQPLKVYVELLFVLTLIILNLRGMKESILVLLPIFLGFVLTHVTLILYGIFVHWDGVGTLISSTVIETHELANQAGWFFVVSLFLRAYSMGSGTYTGLEAVSNNVNTLAEPRVTTGKWTMFYMAISLSFMAGGIILLYLLWNAAPVAGQTLNAVVFSSILEHAHLHHGALVVVLLLEAGLLFVASNTGFLGGPQVLANMAIDAWIPNRFRHLSNRLVIQNGIFLYGFAALLILWISSGKVSLLVVLYSINVFITFSLSLWGLTVYWWRRRRLRPNWLSRLLLSFFACVISSSILAVTIFEKFTSGGWLTLLVTSTVVTFCLMIKNYYERINKKLTEVDKQFPSIPSQKITTIPRLDPDKPTAVFLIGKSLGTGMHTLLWVLRMFPGHFKNFIFVTVGIVDVESFGGKASLESMQHACGNMLKHFVDYCHYYGFAATSYSDFGTDPVDQLTVLCEKINKEFPSSIFFATKLVFENDNWLTRYLHNETSLTLQSKLHENGMQLVILPMKL